jgi:putative Holliday junction resolvase
MARILAIDYGKKRTGLAVTDPLQIIATGLETIPSHQIIPYLKKYLATESVEKILIGYPLSLKGDPTHGTALVQECVRILKKHFPQMPIVEVDERFTSKMAFQSMLDSGMKKKDRQNKGLIDEISATIILQEYLQQLNP